LTSFCRLYMASSSTTWLNRAASVVEAILWPPLAPLGKDSGRLGRDWWGVACFASVIPIAAILHHRIFWKPTCMLNPFGADYTPTIVHSWLLRDPSLPWAIVLAGLAWSLGRAYSPLKYLVAPTFSAFLPLSLWLWDIPFSGRFICHHFHDNRFQLARGVPLVTKDIYAFCALLYLVYVEMLIRKHRRGLVRSTPEREAFVPAD
jgi:hypothetical protein